MKQIVLLFSLILFFGVLTVNGEEEVVLGVEPRIVDLEGAFSDHMTCMLDANPKEKVK